MTSHPDAELLDVCRRLSEMQAEWQRLYDATTDAGPLATSADHAWDQYSKRVWPGVDISTWGNRPVHPDDLPARLRLLRATTVEGMKAKAAAILALDEAGSWTDCRNDHCDLSLSLIRDVAGMERHGLGDG